MKEKFIHHQEFISNVNQTLKSQGLPQIFNEEMFIRLLHQNGWIDNDGLITEEGKKSGMIMQTPPVNLN